MKTKILLILPLLGIFFVVFTNFAMAADCEFNYSATVNQELEISINSLAPCLPANYAVGSGSIILPPTCGVINEINSQRIRYTPTSCCGTDSFEFNATKKNNPPVIVRINVFITCTSQPPTANNDSNSTNEDTQLVVSAPGVLGNDTDPESDPLTASKVSDPSHGTVTLNSNGSYTYTPDANYCGTDSFTYRAHDGLSYSNTATVTITVNCINDPPTAVDDTISTTEDTCAADYNVTANDIDVDGDTLSVTAVTDPAHGTASIVGGLVRYCPDANYCGTDTFDYTLSDGTATDTGTVSVSITCANDPPTAVDDTISTTEDTCADINVLTNDTDPESDPLSLDSFTQGTNGTVTDLTGGVLRYCPDGNWSGIDTFTYVISDGNGGTDTGTVTITVNGVNDVPTANDDSYSTNEDTSLTVAAPGVLGNDTDPDGNPLTAVKVSDPANGSVTLNADGSFTYTPNANFFGTDSFTYMANDGSLDSNIATVTITVFSSGNDPPIAFDDETTTNEDICVDLNLTINDTDPEGDPLKVVWISDPSYGIVTLNDDNHTITYCPALNYCGDDSFEYNVSDGQYTDRGRVTIHILCENDPPVANNDYNTTDSKTCVIINVLQNDYDPESNPLSSSLVTQPAHGKLTFLGDLIGYEYCPDGNFCGIDTFTYVAYDGQYQSDIATVSIEIKCEEIVPKEEVPASLLFPNVNINRLVLTQRIVSIDDPIDEIIGTGTNIIVDGKVITVLEVTPGSRNLLIQIENKGFVTQSDVGIRFEGLPQGATATFSPQLQKIKAHNKGTYIVTLNIPSNVPKGDYFVTAKAFNRSGTLDSEIFSLVIS